MGFISQNYQHYLKNSACFLKHIVQGTQNDIEILIGQVGFKLGQTKKKKKKKKKKRLFDCP